MTAAGVWTAPDQGLGSVAGLGWTLVRTDFKVRYHGTVQGFLWALLKPATMFLVLMGVFAYVFPSERHYRLDLVIGLFLWDFFAQSTAAGLTSLSIKGYLLSKAKIPIWILVVTSLANAAITLAVFVGIILAVLAAAERAPDLAAVALFLWYILHFVAIAIGFSLAASVLFLRYRDLNQVWDMALTAGFFVAPIVYPLGILPEQLQRLIYLWPPTPIIQFSRMVLVSGTTPTLEAHLLLSAGTLTMLGAGVLVYRAGAPRAAEHL